MEKTFQKYGNSFQDKLVTLMLREAAFCDQMREVLDLSLLTKVSHKLLLQLIYEYKDVYRIYPAYDTMTTLISTQLDTQDDNIKREIVSFYSKVIKHETIHDEEYVKSEALQFCKTLKLEEAIIEAAKMVKGGSKFEDLMKIISEAGRLGSDNNFGYNYKDDFEDRFKYIQRNYISTGWPRLDNITRGGLGKKELSVVVASSGCHAKDTDILMFDGTWKKVQDIIVGDKLMGPDSKERNVLCLHRGREQMAKIVPNSNDKPFVVNMSHILSVLNYETKQKENISVRDHLSQKGTRLLYKFIDKKDYNVVSLKQYFFDFSVELLDEDDYFGFEVDGDNLYVMEDYWVTHNSGKSMVLVHLGAAALREGKNVVYYTLELAETSIASRFDACLTGYKMDDMLEHKDKIYNKIKDVQGSLIIKEYPTKTASIMTLRNHLDRLKASGFKTDLVLVDYADLLSTKSSTGQKWSDLEGLYEDLRATAQLYDVSIVTASQTNRTALNQEVVTLESISDAFSKCFVADLIITLSRTPEDKQKNSGRFFIAKNRNGTDGVVFPIEMDTSNVQITILDTELESVEDIRKNSEKKAVISLKQKYNQVKNEIARDDSPASDAAN